METYWTRLEQMDALIRRKCTGPADQLARQMGISMATLYRYLEILREKGAPIAYNRYRCTYYYRESGRFFIGFLTEEDNRKFS